MITVGGFNTAIDKTLDLDELRLGAVNRVRAVRASPGGKGVHVALTLAALGEPVRLVGVIDAGHRVEFEDALGARGVEFHGIEVEGGIRANLDIRDRGGARVTEVLEPGPELDAQVRGELEARYLALAAESDLAVLSGSAPRGFEADAYARLVTALRDARVRCLVDASGELLRRAACARPFLVKPNREEAEALAGRPVPDLAAAAALARGLARDGIEIAIVSMGELGAVAARGERVVHAAAGAVEVKNPVGSGDCLLGGAAAALRRGEDLDAMLRLGVACGAANASAGMRGWLGPGEAEKVLPRVTVAAV